MTFARRLLLAPLLAGAALAAPASAPAQTPAAAAPVDYKDGANWLCRPGRRDACAQDQTATEVLGSGKTRRIAYTQAASPKIDCFYVYPTVSRDATANSDMTAGPEELSVINQQFARFGAVCRQFAPLYRQVTLTALRAGISGQDMKPDRELGYNDVKAAWNDYLARDNGGRGVVLIGHSQGSGVLQRLIKEEIDGKPVQRRMVSALLIGTNVAVPPGKDVGGQFQAVPLCRSAGQTGCVVSYVSFRADAPPPANSRFGRVPAAGMASACTNPAALAGGPAVMHPFLNSRGDSVTQQTEPPVFATGVKVSTPFVTTPGLISAQCVSQGGFTYLAMTINGDPRDPRTDTLAGDVVTGGAIQKDWGLHLVDMNFAMGDLIALVRSQGAAYTARR